MSSQNAFSFVESLRARDIEIVVHDEKLRVTPASSLTLEDRQFIKDNRDRLIALVRVEEPRPLSDMGQRALDALALHGWTGDNAMRVARLIESGETDEDVLIAVLEGRT
ncbi:MAG: hypothetical protein PHF20_05425 [Halothiobacillaceae bacterium]|nr:hypothetical protein [Halothiobacillaceae bacterium]